MSTVLSEDDLVACFRAIDRGDVELSPDFVFPLAVDDVLAWAVGPRAFLVFRDRPTARPRGIVFHRNGGHVPDAASMCEWCHAVRINGGVKLMSVSSDERHRVGLYLCHDLGCVGAERARTSLRRISEFASRRLF